MNLEHPTTHQIGRHYWLTRRMSAPLREAWLDTTIENAEIVPDEGGVIFAANHLSFIDSMLLMYSVRRKVSFLGKSEYLDHPVTRAVFPASGMIPVDRTGRGVGRSLTQAVDKLNAGEIVGIFPEGTRSRDGLLHKGHPGVAHLALRSGAPIVPVGIIGTDKAQPPGARLPRHRSEVRLRFGPPVDLGAWAGARPTGSVKREIADQVMRSIADLSGQTYVDEFAPNPSLVAFS